MAARTQDAPPGAHRSARRDFPALTGLRAVAALWVVVYHVAGNLSGAYERHLQPIWPLLQAGWLGVDVFFVLSGFVITSAYVGRLGARLRLADAADFLWARVARVWPVWALVSVVFAVVLLATGDPERPDSYSAPVTVWNTLDQLLMVQQWGSDSLARTSYVVPGWSLSAEWLAYVCFPVLALVLFRLRGLPWWVLGMGSVLAVTPFAYSCYSGGDDQNTWQLRIVGGFLAGALMALAVARLRVTPAVERLAAVIAVVAVAEVTITCWWSAAQGPVSRTGAAVLVFPVLVGALAVAREGLTRFLSRPLLQLGGRISYSLYLLHSCVFLVFETLAREVDRLTPGGPLYLLVLPQVILLTIPSSYLVWRYVEEPSRRWMLDHRPWPRKQRTVPSATAVTIPAQERAEIHRKASPKSSAMSLR